MQKSPRTEERRFRRRLAGLWAWAAERRGIVLVLSLLTVAALSGVYSLALFTNSTTIPNNSFTAGTVSLTTNPTTALIANAALMPGDTGTNSLVITNNGTAQLRYAMTTSATNVDTKDIRSQITLTIKTIDVTTPAIPCDNFDGTSLYTGSLNLAAIGDPTPGAQAGDRTLAAAAAETLCFRYSFPVGSGNAYQGAVTSATFTFASEQTANNP